MQNDLCREGVDNALSLLSARVGLIEVARGTHRRHTFIHHGNGNVGKSLAEQVGKLAATLSAKALGAVHVFGQSHHNGRDLLLACDLGDLVGGLDDAARADVSDARGEKTAHV